MTCDFCDDGDGGCVYPYYGLAPHSHKLHRGRIVTITSTRDFPDNFVVDQEHPADGPTCGVYTHCLNCGDGKKS